jgi:hypothetical protein
VPARPLSHLQLAGLRAFWQAMKINQQYGRTVRSRAPDSLDAFKLTSTIGIAILSAPSFAERLAKHSDAKRSIARQIEHLAHAPGDRGPMP